MMTQQELEKYLWGAATTLRGTIDAGDYKQYIFPLLFFKRISDVYDEEFEKALAESDGDMEYAAFVKTTISKFQKVHAGKTFVRLRLTSVKHCKAPCVRLSKPTLTPYKGSLVMLAGPTKNVYPTLCSLTLLSITRSIR